MKHQILNYKLSRDTKHRKALAYNLVRSMVLYEKMTSTFAKLKYVQPILEKNINLAKKHLKNSELNKNFDLASYRMLLSFFRNDEVAAKKIIEIAKKMLNRNGGYTRIIKLGQRKGDSAVLGHIIFSGEL